jgi:hypothetical protein
LVNRIFWSFTEFIVIYLFILEVGFGPQDRRYVCGIAANKHFFWAIIQLEKVERVRGIMGIERFAIGPKLSFIIRGGNWY